MSINITRHFESGARRSGDADSQRYDLISPIGLRRLAETYAEGAAKYGDRNWENGFPASVIFNHAVRHLNLWIAGDNGEDHLAHAAWNLFALMHFEERRTDLFDIPARGEVDVELEMARLQGCSPDRDCGRCEHRSCDAENYCEIDDANADGIQRVYFCSGCNRRLAICEWIDCEELHHVPDTCRRESNLFAHGHASVPIFRIASFGQPVQVAVARKLGSQGIMSLDPEDLALFMTRLNVCRHCEENLPALDIWGE